MTTVIKTITHQYVIKQEIGSGQYGKVYKAINENNQIVAIKKIDRTYKYANNELEIMEKVANAGKSMGNVVHLIDSLETEEHLYLVMPYCDQGTLTDFISSHSIKSEEEAVEYFRQICFAIRKLHSINIMHRDIKSDNIFVSSYLDADYPYKHTFLVGDLGLACSYLKYSYLAEIVGTSITMASEVEEGKYNNEADIYSLGCVFYKMLSGESPFVGEESISMSKANGYKPISTCFGHPLSKFSTKILNGCIQYKSENRMHSTALFKALKLDNLYEANYQKIDLNSKDSYITENTQLLSKIKKLESGIQKKKDIIKQLKAKAENTEIYERNDNLLEENKTLKNTLKSLKKINKENITTIEDLTNTIEQLNKNLNIANNKIKTLDEKYQYEIKNYKQLSKTHFDIVKQIQNDEKIKLQYQEKTTKTIKDLEQNVSNLKNQIEEKSMLTSTLKKEVDNYKIKASKLMESQISRKNTNAEIASLSTNLSEYQKLEGKINGMLQVCDAIKARFRAIYGENINASQSLATLLNEARKIIGSLVFQRAHKREVMKYHNYFLSAITQMIPDSIKCDSFYMAMKKYIDLINSCLIYKANS